jgi:arsenate reductase (thioredoxin)
MADKVYNVLFICTGNSARSMLTEGLLSAIGSGRFRAYSAGSRPKDTVHPLALQELQSLHIPTDGFCSKSWEEFAHPEAPEMDFVFTVCDQAAKRKAFRDAAVTIKRRLELMMALPISSLDALAIHREVKDIGTR